MGWIKQLTAAEGYHELGMLDDALQSLEEVSSEDKMREEVLAFRLSLYMNAKKWDRAAEVAAHMIQIAPDEAAGWIDFAYCVRRTRTVQEAEEILMRAISIHPHVALIRYNLACYASVTGRLVEARHRLEEAFALDGHMRQRATQDEDLVPLKEYLAGKA